MKKLKKFLAVGMACLSLCAISTTAYAATNETEVSKAETILATATSTTPACPRCHTNKWVIPHGLVCWSCLKCNYDFW